MVGLALGSWSAISKNKSERRVFPLFRLLQLCMFLYPLLVIVILWLLHRFSSHFQYIWVMGWLFPILTAGAGFIGGYQFPLANRLYLRTGKPVQRVAGLLYGYDLLGSSVGAILTSAFLIPILGIFPTLFLFSFLNLCSFGVVSLSKELLTERSS
jgi:spermidine synthase